MTITVKIPKAEDALTITCRRAQPEAEKYVTAISMGLGAAFPHLMFGLPPIDRSGQELSIRATWKEEDGAKARRIKR